MTTIEYQRHTLAHLLAAAVFELYPEAQPAIGPAIDNGFYYDFDFGNVDTRKQSTDKTQINLVAIESKMKELLPLWTEFSHKEVSADDARTRFADNPYKLELINELEAQGETITLYTCGGFTDLCRGGHAENPSKEIAADSFTLSHIAGAYWRGDEKNTMLTRIYGLAFPTKTELDAYVAQQEEMRRRDHRIIGEQLKLWSFSDLVGSGLPLFSPKGTVLRQSLFDALQEISKRYDMLPVTIPHMAKRKLYEISGHADKFGVELLIVKSHYDEFVLKPVNCPHHTQIYAAEPRSYRDLPLRYMESTMQYRDERPGEIGGLTRVRAITVDDGHIFCRIDQVEEEAIRVAKIIEEFYSALGMWGNHWVSLSVRDPDHPEKYIGDEAGWRTAEDMLKNVSDKLTLNARRMEGEAALYGPKLDFMFVDALGRERQLATIQIDFAMPARFKLEYTDSDGSKKTPVMLHRAILGSYERFMALLIEHFAGAFPVWLSPVQVSVLPVSEKHTAYAESVFQTLKKASIRAELDSSNETLGKKIRNWKLSKNPYAIVIGDKEIASGNLAIETRSGEKLSFALESFIERVRGEIKNRTL